MNIQARQDERGGNDTRRCVSVKIVITGTDTGIGKTVFSAGLVDFLDASYWKPVQSGLGEHTDSESVSYLAQLPPSRIIAEQWRLNTPASPHYAAQIDNVLIDPDQLNVPETNGRSLIIEGAGGLMVPLNRSMLFIDVFARWKLPVVLCARTGLGTINHSLLSIEALRHRNIDVLGVAFIGDANPDSEQIICELGNVRRLGRLPHLKPLKPESLRAAFASAFQKADFLKP
jgi:dethiobiotin synthetase